MKNRNTAVKTIALALAMLLIGLAIVAAIAGIQGQASGATPLTQYWTADSNAAKQLREYVAKVTDPSQKDSFIPVKDRIAVFDMDGTLACETFYTYYDTMMFIEFCLKDHPERVSNQLKQVAISIKPGYVADETLARNFAKAFAGMTMEEFYNYAVEFGQKKTSSFNNMRYLDNFYLPMVELVRYLYENGFTIYVISGTERTTTRAIVANSPIKDYVTPNHVIGTDFEVKQKGHETESSNMNFKYEDGDELVLTGGFIQKNLNGNKSIYVEREIGQRPVLAFGNSGSDTSMMYYTIDSRNQYPAQAYMIVADDSEREWGKQDWDAKSADYTAKGFIPISMKSEFAQIYAEGITKADQQYTPADYDYKFAYDHDPRKNPGAMKDIVEDPKAVYGFAPSPDSPRLATYVQYDWTDEKFVAEAKANRIAYHQSLASLSDILYKMRTVGASTEEMARAISAERNRLRLAAYENDPEGLAKVKESNLNTYGHEDGPTPDQLYAQYGSWKTVIQKAFSPNMGMDAICGLYDEYYPLYVELGLIEE